MDPHLLVRCPLNLCGSRIYGSEELPSPLCETLGALQASGRRIAALGREVRWLWKGGVGPWPESRIVFTVNEQEEGILDNLTASDSPELKKSEGSVVVEETPPPSG